MHTMVAAPHATHGSHLADLEHYEARVFRALFGDSRARYAESFRQSGAAYVPRLTRFADGLVRTNLGGRTPTIEHLLVFGRDIADPLLSADPNPERAVESDARLVHIESPFRHCVTSHPSSSSVLLFTSPYSRSAIS